MKSQKFDKISLLEKVKFFFHPHPNKKTDDRSELKYSKTKCEVAKWAHPRCKNLLNPQVPQNKEKRKQRSQHNIEPRKTIVAKQKKVHRFLHRGKPAK